ncbi:MAG: MaoC family dehydratase [Deltaproteobacteria bacterium]|jgi:3-hydroxybutyryl-CoA dehydratase|nr:MaoC family dehydratase [Deltaproteobacteria bacterium]
MPSFSEMREGDYAERTVAVTEAVLEAFAAVSGDYNPMHMDESYASRSVFRRRVAHGMLPGAFVGAVLGTLLPGPGTVYLSQTLIFRAPVYIGDSVTARVEIASKDEGTGRILLRTTARGPGGALVLDGEAVILFRPADGA